MTLGGEMSYIKVGVLEEIQNFILKIFSLKIISESKY